LQNITTINYSDVSPIYRVAKHAQRASTNVFFWCTKFTYRRDLSYASYFFNQGILVCTNNE